MIQSTIRATNSDVVFNIVLNKPLPFPNMVKLVTLNNSENRKYRCFSEIGDCNVSN